MLISKRQKTHTFFQPDVIIRKTYINNYEKNNFISYSRMKGYKGLLKSNEYAYGKWIMLTIQSILNFSQRNFNKQINIDFQNLIQNSVNEAWDIKRICTFKLKIITVC